MVLHWGSILPACVLMEMGMSGTLTTIRKQRGFKGTLEKENSAMEVNSK